MAFQKGVNLRNAELNAINTQLGSTGTLKIFSGAEPANCAAADPSGLLCTINLPSTPFTTASGGPTVAGIAALIEDSQILVATGTVASPSIIGTFSQAQQNSILVATGVLGPVPPPSTRLPQIAGSEWQQSDRANEPVRDYGY